MKIMDTGFRRYDDGGIMLDCLNRKLAEGHWVTIDDRPVFICD